MAIAAFALSSCKDFRSVEKDDLRPEEYVTSSELSLGLVLAQMHFDGSMILENKGYRITELRESEMKQMWFDENAYKDALRLLDRHNKDLKKMLSELEKKIGTKDYVLHDALNQFDQVYAPNDPEIGKWQDKRLETHNTLPVNTSYKIDDGVKRQTFICCDRWIQRDLTKVNECIHLIATIIGNDIHVYVTILSGPILITLPGTAEEVEVIYMTSFPEGGYCIW